MTLRTTVTLTSAVTEMDRRFRANRLLDTLLFDRNDHPLVPTCPPDAIARSGGQGRPQAAAQRHEPRSCP